MISPLDPTVVLKFPLQVEDGWPPVAVEALPFEPTDRGYRALVAPLFVKDLSVGDIILATLEDDNLVDSWSHVQRSGRTTVWLLRQTKTNQIDPALAALRALGCNSVRLDSAGCYAIDVPETVTIRDVDSVLNSLDSSVVAIAFPSMRHPD